MDESLRLKRFSVVTFFAILVNALIVTCNSHSIMTTSSIITVPDDYPTIQAAVDVANPGDAVYVRTGTYFEWVSVTKSLSLIGENPNTTIIESPAHTYGTGITLSANNITVTGFTIRNHAAGMCVYSSYNTIEGNNILLNDDRNIFVFLNSKNNTISNNVISNGTWGLDFFNSCDYNVISGNRISNNEFGLDISSSHGNTLRDNNMTNNKYNFRVTGWGGNLNNYAHDIDASNTVNGKPVYYWVNHHNKSVPSDAGCVYAVNSTNILVKDLNLTSNGDAVKFIHTSESVIKNVYCSKNMYSILLDYSNMNVIRGNTITSNDGGIYIYSSSNNTIINNTVSENRAGVRVSGGAGNNVSRNSISECAWGLIIYGSTDNRVIDNNMTDSGIVFRYSSTRNTVSGNVISSTRTRGVYGIRIEESGGNTFRNNTLTGEAINFGVYTDTWDSSFSHFIQYADSSNTVNGRPIYYWMNEKDRQIPSDAGYVAVVNSTNITVKDLNLTCNGQGVLFARTTNSTIENVNVSWNEFGIYLFESSSNIINDNVVHRSTSHSGWTGFCGGLWLESSLNNVLTNNTITRGYMGLRLIYSNSNVITENTMVYNWQGIGLTISSDNFVYHNNFINNTKQIGMYKSPDIWDNGCEGNYWSAYNGSDLDGDGIGDTYLPWGDVDNYPLMNPYWNLADINHDLKVNIYDAVLVCAAYSSTPSDSHWNPHSDIAEPYEIIDIYDVVTMAWNYGEEWGNP